MCKIEITSCRDAFFVGTSHSTLFCSEPDTRRFKPSSLSVRLDSWQVTNISLTLYLTRALVLKYTVKVGRCFIRCVDYGAFNANASAKSAAFCPLTNTNTPFPRSHRGPFKQRIACKDANTRSSVRTIHTMKSE